MSQRVYMALLTGASMPVEYLVWKMAEWFGWTLEYIEGLPLARWHELMQIDDGELHIRNSLFNKKKGGAPSHKK